MPAATTFGLVRDGRELYDSTREDDADGFRFVFKVGVTGYPSATLSGDDGEVTAFGLDELRSLLLAAQKAVELGEAAERRRMAPVRKVA